MLCSNCGNDVPMGSAACPYCGAAAPVDMGMQQPYQAAPMDMGMQQPYQAAPMDMGMQQPYQATPAYAAPPANNKKGLIIGLIVGAIAIIAIVLILVFFVFNGDADGTYVFDDYAALGITMEIEIDGDEFVMTIESTLDGTSEKIEGTCKVDGDEIILTYDGDDLACDYDAKEGTINFEGMIFTKE